MGITVDAVRSRVKRGTIDHERIGGRVYVLLGADESRPGHDQDTDQVGDQGATVPEDRTAELIATLREQLQVERQALGLELLLQCGDKLGAAVLGCRGALVAALVGILVVTWARLVVAQ